MTRLIDADALVEDIGNEIDKPKKVTLIADYNHFYCSGMRNVIRLVKRLPTVDPVKHGRWTFIEQLSGGYYSYKCSECQHLENVEKRQMLGNYCSYCGAKMDSEHKEE